MRSWRLCGECGAARETFERLRAAPWLDRLAAVDVQQPAHLSV